MAAPTKTFDDGLYHPYNPVFVVSHATSTTTGLNSATSAVPAATVGTPSQTIAPPLVAPAPPTPSDVPIDPIISSSSSMINSAPTASSSPPQAMPTSSNQPINVGGGSPNQHAATSVAAVVVPVMTIVVVFVIVFVYGYLTSQSFRSWKEKHWSRYPQNPWKVSNGRPSFMYAESPPAVHQKQRESTVGLIAGNDTSEYLHTKKRQNPLPGWLSWVTGPSRKDNLTRFSNITPGWGVGKYRAKHGSHTSRGFKYAVGRSVEVTDLTSTTHDAGLDNVQGASHVLAIGESLDSENTEKKALYAEDGEEELLYDYAKHASNVFNYDQFYHSNQGYPDELPNLSSTGVSYLLTRLKDSISGRTKFSSLGSSNSRGSRPDPSRGRWTEVGRLVADEDLDQEAEEDEDDDEKRGGVLLEKQHVPLTRLEELSLADIALPSLPAFTWDAHSTIKIAQTKRPREPTHVSGDPETREQPPQLLLSSADSTASAKSRKLPLIPSASYAHNKVQIGSRKASHGTHKRRSATTSSSGHKRKGTNSSTAGPTKKVHPNVLASTSNPAGNHVFPGGFVGRSPTKKLRRKASPKY
ncbi:hypothetical protein VP01_707g7 [Puccinia sorghi]|uniref:Uncharacterized protein n=1 Tax=Puccinia sorghi TaxID=27349 RepID=A0A0L6UEH9_9BASI|nr:hypothetical protein VP01_707g7 [Puccinia sorghi]